MSEGRCCAECGCWVYSDQKSFKWGCCGSCMPKLEKLRDHFAGLAMQGLMIADIMRSGSFTSAVPYEAYNMADQMLSERARRQEGEK